MKRAVLIALAITVMAVVHFRYAAMEPATGSGAITLGDARHIFPDAVSVETVDGSSWKNVYGKGGRLEGKITSTSPHSDAIVGYAGPTPLLIGIGSDEKIIGVYPLENEETPSFRENIISSGFFGVFNGVRWKEAGNLTVDAITGATMTSDAMVRSLKHRLLLAASQKPVSEANPDGRNILTIALVLIALWACLFSPAKHEAIRLAVLAASVVYLGFFRGQLLSMQVISAWIKHGVVTASGAVLFGIAAVTIIVSLTKGRAFYCHYICPFGALQEFAGRISPWKISISTRVDRALRKIRYALLFVIAGLLVTGLAGDLTDFEPFTVFAFTSASVTVLILAGVSLFMSLFLCRPWCGFLCPTGALFEIFRIIPSRKGNG